MSVGIVEGKPVLDLDYAEDSNCDTDMNVVMTGAGGFVEVQGTAEGAPFTRDEMDALLGLAEQGHRASWCGAARRRWQALRRGLTRRVEHDRLVLAHRTTPASCASCRRCSRRSASSS